ncbi:hypothetical protein HKCCE2091_16635 [Rhodobacterales bacterium HKCCE2091]|nr:hypothetical protein [Rhodobacterales bacterium HKCCE2091]
MAQDTKSVVTEIANAAMMITPEIPTIGPVLTGVIAAGTAVWDIFFPDDTSIVDQPPITADDLDNAVNELKSYIKANNIQLIIDQKQVEVASLDTSLTRDWHFVTGAVSDSTGTMSEDDKRIAQYKEFLQDVTGSVLTWRNAAAKPVVENDSNLNVAIEVFRSYPDARHLSLPLFLYATNIAILYYKLNVMWDYRQAIADDDDYQPLHDLLKAQILSTDKTMLLNMQKWARGGRKGTNPLDAKIKSIVFCNSPYVEQLNLFLTDKNGCVPLLSGYITDIENAYATRDKRIAAREAQVVVRKKGSSYEVVDTANGNKVVATQSIQKLAQLNARSYAGTVTAEINKEEIVDKHFDLYDADFIKTLKQIRDHWSEINKGALAFITSYSRNVQS